MSAGAGMSWPEARCPAWVIMADSHADWRRRVTLSRGAEPDDAALVGESATYARSGG
jgi:hypothetical protein